MRFFAGEILEDTVKAVSVGPEQKLVDMPAAPEGEHEVTVALQLPYNCHEMLWCCLWYLQMLYATTCNYLQV